MKERIYEKIIPKAYVKDTTVEFVITKEDYSDIMFDADFKDKKTVKVKITDLLSQLATEEELYDAIMKILENKKIEIAQTQLILGENSRR